MSQSAYHPMGGEQDREISQFDTWSSEQLGLFFRNKGLGEYSAVLRKHKITGKLGKEIYSLREKVWILCKLLDMRLIVFLLSLAPLLEDKDLQEIGIDVVGDRLMFKHHLKDLSRRDRFNKRMEVLWQGEEQVFFSSIDRSFFVSNSSTRTRFQQNEVINANYLFSTSSRFFLS